GLHRRRPASCPCRPLPRHHVGRPTQPRYPRFPPAPPRRRKAKNGRNGRLHAQAPHHPQRYPARPQTLATRLTSNTVAELVEGRRAELQSNPRLRLFRRRSCAAGHALLGAQEARQSHIDLWVELRPCPERFEVGIGRKKISVLGGIEPVQRLVRLEFGQRGGEIPFEHVVDSEIIKELRVGRGDLPELLQRVPRRCQILRLATVEQRCRIIELGDNIFLVVLRRQFHVAP